MNSFLYLLPLLLLSPAAALPLSTNGRWIVDETGHRVKFACINWPTHVGPMIAEGLSKRPLDAISGMISSLGFNCVRLTFAIDTVTNCSLSELTVRESLLREGLNESAAAVGVLNPKIIDLKLLDAFEAVVESLGRNNVMVVIDNHVSKHGWCCDNNDGNGFFGDKYFDPEKWIEGLTKMATKFNGTTNVVAFSLRNELRGPRQNPPDWFKYMVRGAEAVHKVNPHVLTVLGGLSYATDLSFLRTRPVSLSFKNKLVHEFHWYSFNDRRGWATGNVNRICARFTGDVMKKNGFLLEQGLPLIMSEFGINQNGNNEGDNHYLPCVLALAAELDLDWALWALPGSYYIRQGKLAMEETYAVVTYDWVHVRNPSFLETVSSIMPAFKGPGFEEVPPYKVIYHPLTGKCVHRSSIGAPVELGPCPESEAWTYRDERLALQGSATCIQAYRAGLPAKISIICGGPESTFKIVGDMKMQLSSNLVSGNKSLCLDVGHDGKTIVTSPCRCIAGERGSCNPLSQWFKLVDNARKIINERSLLHRLQ